MFLFIKHYILTTKSEAPSVLILLFDKSNRSRYVSGASEFQGTVVRALLGRPVILKTVKTK